MAGPESICLEAANFRFSMELNHFATNARFGSAQPAGNPGDCLTAVQQQISSCLHLVCPWACEGSSHRSNATEKKRQPEAQSDTLKWPARGFSEGAYMPKPPTDPADVVCVARKGYLTSGLNDISCTCICPTSRIEPGARLGCGTGVSALLAHVGSGSIVLKKSPVATQEDG